MAETFNISLDAMGGDVGPDVVLAGAAKCLEVRPELRFVIFGDEAVVMPKLKQKHFVMLRRRSKFHHCEVSVGMDDKPSQALRKGRYKSSMWRAIQAVRDGDADLAVSAGNTGALMAMSTFCLKTMANVSRPAIAGIWPTMRGESIMLDLGATIGANEQHLVDCSVMGGAMARALYHLDQPKIGLLNIGVEEVKGIDEVKAASQRLRDANFPNLDYTGFIEGDDIGKGVVDVVVTEGFSGNIALKTAEGTARQIGTYLSDAMGRTWASRLGYLFARNAFAVLRKRMDPRRSNGGVFLGLNGIVIKSHGGADAEGFQAAIEIGHDMARNHLMQKIQTDLARYHSGTDGEAGPAGD